VIAYDRPLDLLEAAYRLDGTDDEWIEGLVKTATTVFAREGLGGGGFILHAKLDCDGRPCIERTSSAFAEGRGMAPSWRVSLTHYPSLPKPLQENLFFGPRTADTSSVATRLGDRQSQHPDWRERSVFDASVVGDAIGLVGHAGLLKVVVLSSALRDTHSLDARSGRLWRRVATHLGTALRLRSDSTTVMQRAEAILSVKGGIERVADGVHSGAVKTGFERRRVARRNGEVPDTALDIWQGLVEGRWSLVDHVDTDGKVFVLALRNDPGREVASALTDRQRGAVSLASLGYGNKQIAYALGLSVSAVGMLLTRARAVTGARTRAELVGQFKREMVAQA